MLAYTNPSVERGRRARAGGAPLRWVTLLDAQAELPAGSAAALTAAGFGVRSIRGLPLFFSWLDQTLEEVGVRSSAGPAPLVVSCVQDGGCGAEATAHLREWSWDVEVLWFAPHPDEALAQRARRLGAILATTPDSAPRLVSAIRAILPEVGAPFARR